DEIDRVLLKDRRVFDVQAARVDPEIGRGSELSACAPRQRPNEIAERWNGLQLPQLEARANGASQIADIFGDQKIMLHEPLDAKQPFAAAITERLSHSRLKVEGQALLGLTREKMQVTADRPEESLAAAEGCELGRRENLCLGLAILGRVQVDGKP